MSKNTRNGKGEEARMGNGNSGRSPSFPFFKQWTVESHPHATPRGAHIVATFSAKDPAGELLPQKIPHDEAEKTQPKPLAENCQSNKAAECG